MGLYRGSTGVKTRSERGYKGNGKENGNHFLGSRVLDLGFRIWRLSFGLVVGRRVYFLAEPRNTGNGSPSLPQ